MSWVFNKIKITFEAKIVHFLRQVKPNCQYSVELHLRGNSTVECQHIIMASISWPLDKSMQLKSIFFYFSTKTYVVGTQKNHHDETVL